MSAGSPAVSRLLGAGADLVERVGLWPGDYWPGCAELSVYCEGDPVCALGALIVAEDGPGVSPPVELSAVVERACAAVECHLGLSGEGAVPEWADAHGRSAGEVVAVLRATAQESAAQEVTAGGGVR